MALYLLVGRAGEVRIARARNGHVACALAGLSEPETGVVRLKEDGPEEVVTLEAFVDVEAVEVPDETGPVTLDDPAGGPAPGVPETIAGPGPAPED